MTKNDHTPIDVENIEHSFSHIRVKTLTKSAFNLKLDKYNVILVVSILFFVASISFWGYVNFYLDSGI